MTENLENCRSLSDHCTTADCLRRAVRMVDVEGCGEHPYCESCAALIELAPDRPFGLTDAEYTAALNRDLMVERARRGDAKAEVARLRAALETFTAACDEFRSRGKIVPAVISQAERVAREALNGGTE